MNTLADIRAEYANTCVLVAQLDPDARARIRDCADRLRAIVDPLGSEGFLALAMVGAVLAMENEDRER